MSQQVTWFKNVTATRGEDVALSMVLHNITHGTTQARCQHARIALATNKREVYNRIKRNLPAVTFAGRFPEERKKTGAPFEPSGFIVLDFDGEDGNGIDHAAAAALRERLRDDPHIYAAFLSVGKGAKALLRIDIANNDQLHTAWSAIVAHYHKYGKLDGSGKDITRLCFIPSDPDCWVRDSVPQPFNWTAPEQRQTAPKLQQTPTRQQTAPTLPPSGDVHPEIAKHIGNTVAQGVRLKASGHASSRHEFVLTACRTAWRYVLGGHITQEQALRVVLDAVRQHIPNDSTRIDDATRAFNAPECEDLARKAGALYPDAPEAATAVPVDITTVDAVRLEAICAKVYMPSWDNEPAKTPPVLRFAVGTDNECDVGSIGSITAIVASYSTGKSTVSSTIWAAYHLDDTTEADTLGITVQRPEGKPHAIYLDSEQAKRESWDAWQRAQRRAGYDGGDFAANNYHCLSHLESNLDRQLYLWFLLEEVGEQVGLVVIDGIADFVNNVNDHIEVDAFMQRLRRAASERDICCVGTIHINKGASSTAARGHLGSDILRRASAFLTLTKDTEREVHTITVEKSRSGRSHGKWHFTWDTEQKRHVSTQAPAPRISAAVSALVTRLVGLLVPSGTYTRADIQAKLLVLEPDLGSKNEDTRKKHATRTIKAAEAAGLIEKAGRNQYRLVPKNAGESDPDFGALF